MTTFTLPDFFEDPSSFSLRQATNQRGFAAPGGGSESVVDMMNDRWQASVTLSSRWHYDAALVESFIASMRGLTNTVSLYHLARPQPRGTMRGSLQIFIATGPGADAIYVEGGAPFSSVGGGDMFAVGGMLLQAAEDRIADGSGRIGIPLVNRLRVATSIGQAVTWDRPTAPFRLVSQSSVSYIPGYTPEVSFEFVEAIQ